MDHEVIPHLIGVLAVTLAAAKLCGALAQRMGQPAVLGELVAGVLLGGSLLGLVDPQTEALRLLGELGAVLLLFEIGLETDLKKLLQVGGTAASVAIVGVALPFALGYAACRVLGQPNLVAIVAGAALTATSVGITARVLSDLGRLQETESQIILGAAVLDDVIGLVILTVVDGVSRGQEVSAWRIASVSGLAVLFLAGTLVVGRVAVPPLFRLAGRLDLLGSATMLAVLVALTLAWLAAQAGLAPIVGAFAAGLLLSKSPQAREIERGATHLGHFFVPLFFVFVGAQVDVRTINPFDAGNHGTLLTGALLLVVAVAGKFLAGYSPFWFRGRKTVVGIGMVPRGEVGLIFSDMGKRAGVFSPAFFSAMTLVVMVTTFLTPPLLKLVFPRRPRRGPDKLEGVQEMVMEA